jgi:hypothetical protein
MLDRTIHGSPNNVPAAAERCNPAAFVPAVVAAYPVPG